MRRVTVSAVLFDFSGTLFRLEHDGSLLAELREVPDEPRELLNEREAELVRRLTAPVGPLDGLPAELQDAWQRRDLDPALHRDIHLEVFRRIGLDRPGLAEQLYARLISPEYWQPYPDTAQALRLLRAAGVRVAVVSNIAWDIRSVFARHGVLDLVDEMVLSYVEGAIKPDPKLFRAACERLGVAPERTLMIGDSPEADGGAEAVGCRVAIVDPLPTAQRPDALLRVLAEHGLGGRGRAVR